MISRTDIEDMTDAQDEALKPCPFCGAKPHQNLGKVWHCQLRGDRHQDHIIKCPHLCVTMTGSEDGVRERWNRRADLARPSQAGDAERVQAMRDANWRPAVDYWRERAEKAEAALAAMDTPKGGGDE